ncbi:MULTISPECIES: ABC transporter permease [unclassified Brevibacterium]|uniref:ABC transporter permease n=1 Tax=unclassified Brevibacterium TaxID=2614124 RepID=UPI0010F7D114|nr:ABC transporter permease [Brevibacterium sp. 2SA]
MKNPLGLTTIPSVKLDGLTPVGRRTRFDVYLKRLWERRHFIIADSRAKASGSTRSNILGYAWLFLNPILSVLAFYAIFGLVLGTSRGVDNFIGFLVIGVFFFQYTSRTMTRGIASVRAGSSMIRAFQFPRVAVPISTVVRNLLDFIPSLAVMVVLLAIIPPLEVVTWRVVLIIPVVVLQTAFNIGLACLLARLGHAVPDLTNVASVLSRFWLYGSGVFFSIDDRLAAFPTVLSIMQFNPMYAFLTIARNSLLYGVDTPMHLWLIAIGWSIGLLVVGFVFFWQGEEKYGRA